VAGDRHDAPPEARRQRAGIAVSRDHDIAGFGRAATARDAPAGAATGEAFDRRVGADRDTAPPACVEQAFVVERRMDARRALNDHAAIIIIAGDFLALAFARHHVGA
jgi:hypothetical protein